MSSEYKYPIVDQLWVSNKKEAKGFTLSTPSIGKFGTQYQQDDKGRVSQVYRCSGYYKFVISLYFTSKRVVV